MRKYEENTGITLIALVVTIILLLVLSGISISMLTGQNGILNRVQEAKKNSQVANEKEEINIAVLEALTTGGGTITETNLKVAMKSYLGKDVELTGSGPWQYIGTEGAYAITDKGSVSKGWVTKYNENGVPESVTNGILTLNIGDYINYDPGLEAKYISAPGTVQKNTYYVISPYNDTWKCSKASEYQKELEKGEVEKGNGSSRQEYLASDANIGDIKWRVIGTNEENGELLIIASDTIKTINDKNEVTTKKMYFGGITGYLYGIDELNKVCNVYGQGKGATGGRSLTYNDVEKVIGKTKDTNNMEYSYVWTQDSNKKHSPSYDGGTNYLMFGHVITDNDLKTTSVGIFNFYNAETGKWETSEQELEGLTETKKIGTIKSNYIGYKDAGEMQKLTKGYDVLFHDSKGQDVRRRQFILVRFFILWSTF